ncbi:MAG: hypothetical protein RL522_790 [Pseudomonadota bacterium]|jgi:competence protein ComEA
MLKKISALIACFIASAAMAAVDVNKGTQAELDGLPGIGPATSQLILNERKKSDFKDWADLMKRVKGIGEARAAKLSAAGLTVNGTAYKEKAARKADTHTPSGTDKPAGLTPAAVKPLEKKTPESKPADSKSTEAASHK